VDGSAEGTINENSVVATNACDLAYGIDIPDVDPVSVRDRGPMLCWTLRQEAHQPLDQQVAIVCEREACKGLERRVGAVDLRP